MGHGPAAPPRRMKMVGDCRGLREAVAIWCCEPDDNVAWELGAEPRTVL